MTSLAYLLRMLEGRIDDSLVMQEKRQKMYEDVMHFEGNMFLIMVCDPLNLTLCTHFE